MTSYDTGSASESPHLNSLLSKLRPFQRTAFEFAVHGRTTQTEDKKVAHAKRGRSDKDDDVWIDSAPRRSSKTVAGAGTGRILLGDEMGLGLVLIYSY